MASMPTIVPTAQQDIHRSPEPLRIMCTSDTAYARHLAVTLVSVFENHRSSLPIEIYLLDGGLSPDALAKLTDLIHHYGASLKTILPKSEAYAGLAIRKNLTVGTYYRLAVTQIVPPDATRMLHLDSDMVIRESLLPLWQLELGDHAIAAVSDVETSRHQVLGIPPGHRYFNAGVMLINLDVWRREDLGNRVIEYVRANPDKILHSDQDGLNALLVGRWLELEPAWNLQTSFIFRQQFAERWIGAARIRQALTAPKIVHFTAPYKPWDALSIHPWAHEYYAYLAKTPWRDADTPARPWRTQLRATARKAKRLWWPRVQYWRDRILQRMSNA